MEKIKTDRLYLRELTHDDTKALHQILGDAEAMRYYPSTYSIERTKEWIDRSIASYQVQEFGLWAVFMKESNQFIGQCGISMQLIDGESVPEIGYHLHKNFWNQGLATEAASACLHYGFTQFNLNALYIHTYIKNIPSQRIAEKIGMSKIKTYDKYLKYHKLTWKHVVYAITQLDFFAQQNN